MAKNPSSIGAYHPTLEVFTVSVFWLMIDDETNMNLPVWGVVVSPKKQTTEMTRVA